MDAIYYISGVLMIPTFIGLMIALILFLLKPHLLQKSKHVNKPVPRTAILGVGMVVLFAAFIGYGSVLAATEPAGVKQERLAREAVETKARQAAEQKAKEATEAQRTREEEARRPIVKAETKTEVVPFESTEQQDNTLAKGQTRVATEGVNGERTITYDVTYVQNKETARKEVKNEITKAPVAKVTQIGTYVTPPPAPVTPAPAPQIRSNVRTGAICEDGWHSSATGRGACSHHGGVAYWLYG
jgi:hypothetical protein